MKFAPPILKAFLQQARTKSVPSGQIIIYEGNAIHDVFIVKSGIVKLHDIDNNGNDKVLHLLQPDTIVPLAFYSGRQAKATRWYYTALTDCELYVLTNDALQTLIEQHNAAALYLFNNFSEQVHEIIVRLDSLGKTTIQNKVLAVLRYLVACHTKRTAQQWQRVNFNVSHQLIADMIGATRESTAMAMKRLADSGIVRYPKLTVLEINTKKLYN